MSQGSIVAAVDCGTNSTRLLVTDGMGDPLAREMRITRLGQGVDATGHLAAEAVQRTLNVLGEYRDLMADLGVASVRAVATSAVRDAENGTEFLDEAALILGASPELLSGEEEGRLSLAGALSDVDPAVVHGPYLVVDIGGGSTELVAGTGADDPALSVVSLQIGCVRITERFLAGDPPTADELHEAESAVGAMVDGAVGELPHLVDAHVLVGLAGTVSTLVSLELGLAAYDRDLVHHAHLPAATVFEWYRTLAAEPAAERARRPGMVAGREDVIAGGALILATVMGRMGFDDCLVSEADILDGLAASIR